MVIIVNDANKVFISEDVKPYLNMKAMMAFDIGLDYMLVGLYSGSCKGNVNTFGTNTIERNVFGDFVILKYDEKHSAPTEFTNSEELIDIILKIISKNDYLTLENTVKEELPSKQITFGTYPQSLIIDRNLISELEEIEETNEKDYLYHKGKYYIRIPNNKDRYVKVRGKRFQAVEGINYYFAVEPIKWDILYDGDEKMLLSSKVIDYYPYNINSHNIRLDDRKIDENEYYFSDVRKYLNKYFYNIAFSEKEKEKIISPISDNNFQDRVTLLSLEIIDYVNNINCKATDYCEFIGLEELDENLNVSWWLKSKGQSETDVKTITNKGKETTDKNCYNTRCGIRPLINLKNKAF